MRAPQLLFFVFCFAAPAGCGMPRDPDGSFQRVQSGTLRAGFTENAPWASLKDTGPGGIEVALVEAFAREVNAQVVWTRDSEADLIEALQGGRLDIVVGGLRESTPWKSQISLTRPYAATGGEGRVMAVRQGENRWLLEVDKFLQKRAQQGAGAP